MECEKQKGTWYRWVVFGLSALMIFFVLGFGSSTKATYLKAICDDLRFDRSVFSFNSTIQYIISAVLNFLFGTFIARFGAKKLMSVGFLSLIASFTLQALSTEIWQFYLSGALLGVGMSLNTTAVVAYMIGQWFPKKKGTVLGITLAANGLGAMASEFVITKLVYESDVLVESSPLVAALTRLLHTTGWRLASLLTAAIYVLIGIVILIFIKPSPEKKKADASSALKKTERSSANTSALLKKPYFYISGICIFFTGFILQSAYSIAKSHVLDVGFDAAYVVRVFSMISLLIACSKVINGFLTDKLGVRITCTLCYAFGTVAMVLLAFVTPQAPILAWIFGVFEPLALPLETVMITLLVGELFAKEYFTKTLGYYLAFNYMGYACGIPFINLFYDRFGSYKGILIAYAVGLAIVMVVSLISMSLAAKDKSKADEKI